ncbi:MAG: hypothetical protein Q4E38_05840 [Eubacteriales bacterium]|nr:hypothetical protein [Eubacteriales bacterium]
MKAIHKRSDGAFLRGVAALLFLAACAWGGVGLYSRLRVPARPAAAEAAASLPTLSGLCLRREIPLCLPPSAALTVRNGERVPAGGLLGRDADGTPIRAEAPALFFSGFDGLEGLDTASLEPLSADAVRALLGREGLVPSGCRGRLVLDTVWYYAALAPSGTELPEPGACRLRFAGTNAWVPARLLAVSGEAEGEHALLFRLSRGGDYLSLRRVEAALYPST